jgi:hypothetical protein
MADVVSVYGPKAGKFLSLGGDASMDVFKKYGKHHALPTAMDAAIRHGDEGVKLLEKTGPDKFMRYLTLSKFMTRGLRSWHQERLSELFKMLVLYLFHLLMSILSLLPVLLRYALLIVSGVVVIGIPFRYLYKVARLFWKPRAVPT